ncbi:MAG: bifunctional DNA primase/polymerase [Helicobacteraceae bacterium]|nr:bifunctional DNA primase/polymerase [Helicobacteraceae bacterium]
MIRDNIIVLAKSTKHGGYCVAGKSLMTGKWYRFVQDKDGSAEAPLIKI